MQTCVDFQIFFSVVCNFGSYSEGCRQACRVVCNFNLSIPNNLYLIIIIIKDVRFSWLIHLFLNTLIVDKNYPPLPPINCITVRLQKTRTRRTIPPYDHVRYEILPQVFLLVGLSSSF
jgi:hypothetical protein